jgi:hypothetical protein
METFTFVCPNTKMRVQGFIAEEVSDGDDYAAIQCLMCTRIHYVNPETGRVLGQDEKDE